MSLFGPSREEITTDPCIPLIVKFCEVITHIKEKNSNSSWIDFYSAPINPVEIVCRYYEYDCTTAEILYNELHSENNYPAKQDVIKLEQERFDELICKDELPFRTQINLEEDGHFSLFFHSRVQYPKAVKKYRDVVADAISDAGIPFSNTNENGVKEPARIWLEHYNRYR